MRSFDCSNFCSYVWFFEQSNQTNKSWKNRTNDRTKVRRIEKKISWKKDYWKKKASPRSIYFFRSKKFLEIKKAKFQMTFSNISLHKKKIPKESWNIRNNIWIWQNFFLEKKFRKKKRRNFVRFLCCYEFANKMWQYFFHKEWHSKTSFEILLFLFREIFFNEKSFFRRSF